MSDLTHFNEQGRARMVDISDKQESVRVAVAHSSIVVNEEIYQHIQKGTSKKGDVLAVAQVAGIMAAKQTSVIIPMCHPLSLSGIDLSFEWDVTSRYELKISASVKTKGSTGVEMEALTAASVCALTIYDMCKASDKGMVIGPTFLAEKTGGKNGDYQRDRSPEMKL